MIHNIRESGSVGAENAKTINWLASLALTEASRDYGKSGARSLRSEPWKELKVVPQKAELLSCHWEFVIRETWKVWRNSETMHRHRIVPTNIWYKLVAHQRELFKCIMYSSKLKDKGRYNDNRVSIAVVIPQDISKERWITMSPFISALIVSAVHLYLP